MNFGSTKARTGVRSFSRQGSLISQRVCKLIPKMSKGAFVGGLMLFGQAS